MYHNPEAELHTDRTTGAVTVLGFTAAALAGTCFVAFGLWLSPGWANGWPFGLHRNIVWPAGLAFVSFAAILIAWAGAGLAAGKALGPRTGFWPPMKWYGLWLLACAPVAAPVAWEIFEALHEQAVVLWP